MVPIVGFAQFTFTTNSDGTLNVSQYTGSGGEVSIPNTTNGLLITTIGNSAFQNSFGVTSIFIGSNVTYFGIHAFAACPLLTGVYFTGNAPTITNNITVFFGDFAKAYYLPMTHGWGTSFDGIPAVPWNPLAQTSDGSFGVQNNQFGFNITGSSNLVIVVEAATNLANPVWSPVSTNTLTSRTSFFSDPQWTNYPSRFYRLSSP